MIRQIARQQYLRQAFTQSSSSLSSSILSPISFIRPSASFLSDSRVLFSTDAHGTDTTQRTTTSTGASYLNASNSNSPTSPAGIKKTSEEEREEYNAAQQTTESQAYADAEAMVGTPEAGQEWQEFKDSGMEFIYEDDSHIDEDVLKHMEESLEAVLNHSVRRKRQFPADLVDQTRELALKVSPVFRVHYMYIYIQC